MVIPLLASGPVSWSAYHRLPHCAGYVALQRYSQRFFEQHRQILRHYYRQWTHHPFHHWSRRYEYPYAFAAVADYVAAHPQRPLALLDAGSGITFFPYFLTESLTNLAVTCCDSDPMLYHLFPVLNHHCGRNVEFQQCEIRATPFASGAFNLIYSLSVLEHTHDYPAIVAEFDRLLLPGGRLVLSFDISLDDRSSLRRSHLQALLQALQQRFTALDMGALELTDRLTSTVPPDLVITRRAAALDPTLLPWKFPRFAGAYCDWRHGNRPRFSVLELAFSCHIFQKP